MKAFLEDNSPSVVALMISIIATGYALVDRTVSKELFVLYGVEATGLYGLSQQSRPSYETTRKQEDGK